METKHTWTDLTFDEKMQVIQSWRAIYPRKGLAIVVAELKKQSFRYNTEFGFPILEVF